MPSATTILLEKSSEYVKIQMSKIPLEVCVGLAENIKVTTTRTCRPTVVKEKIFTSKHFLPTEEAKVYTDSGTVGLILFCLQRKKVTIVLEKKKNDPTLPLFCKIAHGSAKSLHIHKQQ